MAKVSSIFTLKGVSSVPSGENVSSTFTGKGAVSAIDDKNISSTFTGKSVSSIFTESGAAGVTYYILMESGSIILAENGNYLRLE